MGAESCPGASLCPYQFLAKCSELRALTSLKRHQWHAEKTVTFFNEIPGMPVGNADQARRSREFLRCLNRFKQRKQNRRQPRAIFRFDDPLALDQNLSNKLKIN